MLTKEQIAQRIAKELKDGYYVNLGIGIPTLVANYIPEGMQVIIQPKSAWVDEWEEGKGTIKLEMVFAANVSGHYYTREETVEKFSVEDLLHEIDFLKASI